MEIHCGKGEKWSLSLGAFPFVSINISFLSKADIDYTEGANETQPSCAGQCRAIRSPLAEEDIVTVYPPLSVPLSERRCFRIPGPPTPAPRAPPLLRGLLPCPEGPTHAPWVPPLPFGLHLTAQATDKPPSPDSPARWAALSFLLLAICSRCSDSLSAHPRQGLSEQEGVGVSDEGLATPPHSARGEHQLSGFICIFLSQIMKLAMSFLR